MFKNYKEIKDFIEWCKANKVKSFKHGETCFEISDIAFIDGLSEPQLGEIAQETREDAKFEEAQQEEEDKEMLYWSAD